MTEFKMLQERGLMFQYDGQILHCKPIITHLSVDLMAKAKIQQIMLFNSENACTFCIHPGEPIVGTKNRTYTIYTAAENHHRYRDHEETLGQMMIAHRHNKIVQGIRGISCMTAFDDFNIIFGFCLDYMHCVLEGVFKALLNLMTNSKYFEENFYIPPKKQSLLSKRIVQIKPSSIISCRPRPLDEIKQYKAKDFRNLLLYYMPICSRGILKPVYYEHFLLLSTAIYTLLKSEISASEVNLAETKLQRFVKDFESLYAPQYVTMNIQLLSHLAESVRRSGPLWAQSTFFFESYNGIILKSIQGPTNKLTQILKKYILKSACTKDTADNGCEELKFLGSSEIYKPSPEEAAALSTVGFIGTVIETFKRFKRDDIIYTSICYKRAKVTCDFFLQLEDVEHTLGMATYYFSFLNEMYVIKKFVIECECTDAILKVIATGEYIVANVTDIKFKYIYVNHRTPFYNRQYIVQPPNLIEKF